jgi:alkylation response protein AidB-like acyl-CoA dehydrogenase
MRNCVHVDAFVIYPASARSGNPRSNAREAAITTTHSNLLDRTEIIRRAAAMAPSLRERAPQGDQLRRLPDQTLADFAESKVLRVCRPARFGGSELGWDALCETIIELGRGDGAQAWVASVYGAMDYMAALFEDEAQHDIWDRDLDVVVAGSLVPVGNKVERVDGGFRLTGKWPFASGAHHAGWFIIGEFGDPGNGTREHLYFLVPAKDLRIADDWHTVGMVGTGSATVVLDNAFVPAYRAMLNRDMAEGKAPGTKVNTAPVFRMPLFGYAQQTLASAPIGVVIGMVEDFKAYIRSKSGPAPVLGIELLHERLSEAAAEIRAATLLLLDTARANMAKLAEGKLLGDADAAVSMRDSGYAMLLAKRAATTIFEATGAHGLYLHAPIQRAFRDVYASANHGSLTWGRSALRYAQSALGLPKA